VSRININTSLVSGFNAENSVDNIKRLYRIVLAMMLFENDISDIKSSLRNLRFSNLDIKFIEKYVLFIRLSIKDRKYALYGAVYRDFDNIQDYILIVRHIFGDVEFVDDIINRMVMFPVSATDLIELGARGRNIDLWLKKLEHEWLMSSCTLSRIKLLDFYIKHVYTEEASDSRYKQEGVAIQE
jgi:hypothetical protein